MRTKAEYRSAIRSRRLIREAFLQLLKEKDISKITVTDIVKLADINRAKFYAHYPDVRGVVEEIENEIIGKMMSILSEFEYRTFFNDPQPLVQAVSSYLETDQEFYRTLIQANGAEIFLEKLKKIFVDYMKNDADIPAEVRTSKEFSMRICFFSGGIINMYRKWFSGELDCTLDDITSEICRLLRFSA